MTCAQHAAHNPKFEKMRLFRHPRWQHLDYRVKVATTQENKPPTQGTRQWTFTTPRWRCGSILLPSLNAGVPEPTGGEWPWRYRSRSKVIMCDTSSHAGDHLYQIWKESIKNCRCYREDTIFKAKAKWPWRYRSWSKVIICHTPSHASDHLC